MRNLVLALFASPQTKTAWSRKMLAPSFEVKLLKLDDGDGLGMHSISYMVGS